MVLGGPVNGLEVKLISLVAANDLAKAITNGYMPLGGVLIKEEIAEGY